MLDFCKSAINSILRKALIRIRYPLDVMRMYMCWYVAYPLSLRHVEEMIAKRAVFSLTTSPFKDWQSSR
jgi:putative transposase